MLLLLLLYVVLLLLNGERSKSSWHQSTNTIERGRTWKCKTETVVVGDLSDFVRARAAKPNAKEDERRSHAQNLTKYKYKEIHNKRAIEFEIVNCASW